MENRFTYQISEQEYLSLQNPFFQHKKKVSSFCGGAGRRDFHTFRKSSLLIHLKIFFYYKGKIYDDKNVQIYTCIRFRDGDQSEDQEPVNQT